MFCVFADTMPWFDSPTAIEEVSCPKKFCELVLNRTKPGPVGWLKILVGLGLGLGLGVGRGRWAG